MFKVYIDRFSVFEGNVHLAGWAFADDRAIVAIDFVENGTPPHSLGNINQPSPDVAAHFGPAGAAARFEDRFQLPEGVQSPRQAMLRLHFADGSLETIADIGQAELGYEPGHALFTTFLKRLQQMPPGRFLELGSRARSGVTRRHLIPEGWTYIGVDILAGPNVDVVVDAHRLSAAIRRNSIDAMMSISVFEHLAMPWKVVLELNRIMTMGGIGLIQTHQAYPLHDTPCDYWRISSYAWPSLFNPGTGFRVVESAMAEPAYMVAARWHPIVDHGIAPGYAVSSVMFEKVRDTRLRWDVMPESLAYAPYPH